MKPKMFFNDSAIPFILEIFNCTLKNDIIIDSNGNNITSPEGDILTLKNFGSIIKSKTTNQPLFIKNDLLSIMKIAEGEY